MSKYSEKVASRPASTKKSGRKKVHAPRVVDHKKTHQPVIIQDNRSYWSGQEAEEIIQRCVEGEKIAGDAERLDVMVDPETAGVWLGRNKHNRKPTEASIARYAEDMIHRRWPYTHQGLGFDIHGYLLDGQNRLHAIIRSGCTVPMQVTINLPSEVGEFIDQGRQRTLADVATLATGEMWESRVTGIANRMMSSVTQSYTGRSRTEQLEFVLKHADAIRFASRALPKNSVAGNAAPRAVVARAYYTVRPEKLERFCSVLATGRYLPGEEAALTLRDHLINNRGKTSGRASVVDLYRKTEYALLRFVEGKAAGQLRAVNQEQFLLPEEKVGTPIVAD